MFPGSLMVTYRPNLIFLELSLLVSVQKSTSSAKPIMQFDLPFLRRTLSLAFEVAARRVSACPQS